MKYDGLQFLLIITAICYGLFILDGIISINSFFHNQIMIGCLCAGAAIIWFIGSIVNANIFDSKIRNKIDS